MHLIGNILEYYYYNSSFDDLFNIYPKEEGMSVARNMYRVRGFCFGSPSSTIVNTSL